MAHPFPAALSRFVAVMAFACPLVAPAKAMYCGTSLVLEGQTQYQVATNCGDPAWRQTNIVYRSLANGTGVGPQAGVLQQTIVPVMVEEWIYDFGPTQLMQSLTFESGRLIQLRSLGYGH
jgi:heme A synthase